MKDFLNQDLATGDFVVMMRPGYRELMVGRVDGLTPKKVRVKYQPHWDKNGNLENVVIDSTNLVKLEPTDALALRLKGLT
jgi:hypothetical protein